MRTSVSVVLLLALSVASAQPAEQQVWLENLEMYWSEIEVEYKDSEASPLKEQDRRKFQHFDRFKPNNSWVVEAIFSSAPSDPFEMPTSGDRRPVYRAVGTLSFKVDGTKVQLPVYQNIELSKDEEHENYLFLPFTDLTNAFETYGGGRYLDLEGPLEGTIDLDFNRAYNPYCAYNDRYSCPIPPKENHMPMRVEAGVKVFEDH